MTAIRDNFSSSNLYVLYPSKIVDVSTFFSNSGIMHQKVTFEKSEMPSIGYFNFFSKRYLDVFSTFDSYKYFYSEDYLQGSGVLDNQRFLEYTGVFDGDITLFSDYMFALDLGNGLIDRFKYFKHPFRLNNMDLKDVISQFLLNEKVSYSLCELKDLRNSLINMDPEVCFRYYKVAGKISKFKYVFFEQEKALEYSFQKVFSK